MKWAGSASRAASVTEFIMSSHQGGGKRPRSPNHCDQGGRRARTRADHDALDCEEWLERVIDLSEHSPELLLPAEPARAGAEHSKALCLAWEGANRLIEGVAASAPADNATEHDGARLRLRAVSECAMSQIARQAAGLRSNTQRQETASNAELVISNHARALAFMLAHADSPAKPPLDVETLRAAHRLVCSGLYPHAGAIRTRAVRAGERPCCAAEVVPARFARCE